MTLSRVSTAAGASGRGDLLTQELVSGSGPKTSVSISELWRFRGFSRLLLFFNPCYFNLVVLKRRMLLSIAGCIVFGICIICIGCIVLRMCRKKGLTSFYELCFAKVSPINIR